MNNEVKSMLKDAGILLLITLVAGAILGGVYQITKEPIARQDDLKRQEAYKQVFADAGSFEPVADFSTDDAKAVIGADYPGQDIEAVSKALGSGGEEMGYVITVNSHEGYGGDIIFSIGIQADGTINGISILSISETAGLGMRAEEVLQPQFTNKKVDKFEVTKTGAGSDNQIDAISGATITSNAVVNGVNAGLCYFQNELGGGGK